MNDMRIPAKDLLVEKNHESPLKWLMYFMHTLDIAIKAPDFETNFFFICFLSVMKMIR